MYAYTTAWTFLNIKFRARVIGHGSFDVCGASRSVIRVGLTVSRRGVLINSAVTNSPTRVIKDHSDHWGSARII